MKNKKIVYFSSTVWNFYKARPQELAAALQRYFDYTVIFVEPIVYADAASIRLRDVSHNDCEFIRIVKRKTRFRKSLFLLFYENIHNAFLLHRLHPDVVISNDHLMSTLMVLYCRLKKKLFYFDHLDDWVDIERGLLNHFYVKKIVYPLLGKYASGFMSTSHYLQKKSQKYTKNSFMIPNGKSNTDIIEFQRTKKEGGNTVNFIATLRDWYDFDLLIDVFTQLPQLQLHIYGNGPLLTDLQKRVAGSTNIRLCGSVESKMVPSLIGSSVFGVLPFNEREVNEGQLPIKLLDYWAAGKVVIATPTQEMRLMASDCCIFAKTKTEWINAMQVLLRDTQLRKEYGARGYQHILQKYSYTTIASTVNSVLQNQ